MRLGSCRVQFKGEGVEQLGDDINMNLYIKNIEDIKNACIKKEIDYDYDVSITVPISGIHYYEGFFKRNYTAYVMINI